MTIYKGIHFGLHRYTSFVLFSVAILIGLAMYSDLISNAQRDVIMAYQKNNTLCHILSKEPKLAQGNCLNPDSQIPSAKAANLTIDALYYMYLEAELFNEDDLSLPREVVLANKQIGTAVITSILQRNDLLDLTSTNALDWIVALNQALSTKNAFTDSQDDSLKTAKSDAKQLLINGLSNIKPREGYWADLISAIDASAEPVNWEHIYGNEKGMTEPVTPKAFSFFPKRLISDTDLLSMLQTKYHVNRSHGVDNAGGDLQLWGYPRGLTSPGSSFEMPGITIDIPTGNIIKAPQGHENETIKVFSKDEEQWLKIYSAINTFSLYLLGQIHADPMVADNKKSLTIIRGPEQAFMIILFVYALMVIMMRGGYRIFILERNIKENEKKLITLVPALDQQNDAELQADIALVSEMINEQKSSEVSKNTILIKYFTMLLKKMKNPLPGDIEKVKNNIELDNERIYNSRWIIRWTALTIPAIGFIGTVRGILTSLTKADGIVWATTRGERAEAIGTLSGELGLAFATTLIALLLGIALSIINEWQTKNESNFIQDLEELLNKILDPRIR